MSTCLQPKGAGCHLELHATHLHLPTQWKPVRQAIHQKTRQLKKTTAEHQRIAGSTYKKAKRHRIISCAVCLWVKACYNLHQVWCTILVCFRVRASAQAMDDIAETSKCAAYCILCVDCARKIERMEKESI